MPKGTNRLGCFLFKGLFLFRRWSREPRLRDFGGFGIWGLGFAVQGLGPLGLLEGAGDLVSWLKEGL